MTTTNTPPRALSRRNVLRAGVVGGAVVWAVPTIQLLDGRKAFAATGSGSSGGGGGGGGGGGTNPPPVTTTPPPVTTTTNPPAVTTSPTLSTSVQGESFSKDPSASKSTNVLGFTTTAGGSLPFTGSNLPVLPAVATGAGLVAGGAVLRALAARRNGEAPSGGAHRAGAPEGTTPASPDDV